MLVFICKILKDDLYIDVSITELLDLHSCKSDSWRKYTCTSVFVGVRGKGGRVSSAWWHERTALRFALWG